VQLSRLAGAEPVAAVDPLEHRLEAARSFGAGGPVGDADVVFEVSGSDDALAAAIAAARPGGRIVLVGNPDGDRTSFAAAAARRKELTLALCRRMLPSDLPRAIELAGSGRVDLATLVSERFPLSDGAQAFRALANRRGLKVVVEPEDDGG
jgi:L-iditol 2-dehydrogenase